MLDTPILFLVFNRPDTTSRVFDEIRKVQPKRLYVAADGPRDQKEGESSIVEKVREIATNVDWPCEVKTLFRQENLGCKIAVSSAITWFFRNETEGIILEDDCLPSRSFFHFCEENLHEYRHNNSIWHISGSSLISNCNMNQPYYYSRYPGIWGWATWRNRWEKYKIDYSNISFNDILPAKSSITISKKYWANIYKQISENDIDTWDYQWVFTVWLHNGYSVNPFQNLISNIGFNENATHTKHDIYGLSSKKVQNINRITHPNVIEYNYIYDLLLRVKYFSNIAKIINIF